MNKLLIADVNFRLALLALWALLLLGACGPPEFGSEDWCEKLRDTPKMEWTAADVKGFTDYCIGRNPE